MTSCKTFFFLKRVPPPQPPVLESRPATPLVLGLALLVHTLCSSSFSPFLGLTVFGFPGFRSAFEAVLFSPRKRESIRSVRMAHKRATRRVGSDDAVNQINDAPTSKTPPAWYCTLVVRTRTNDYDLRSIAVLLIQLSTQLLASLYMHSNFIRNATWNAITVTLPQGPDHV